MKAFLASIERVIRQRLARISRRVGAPPEALDAMVGKMLRSRLGAHLAASGLGTASDEVIQAACVGTELIHTATLCHDDVIDNSYMRRNRPTLWRATGVSGAVLIGDIFLTEAIVVVSEVESGRHVNRFMEKVKEVCLAEAEQELKYRGDHVDADTWTRICREKTGALFAFVAQACGGDDRKLGDALEESGYLVGAIYQMIDDLLDVAGDESVIGKTLGTDAARQKFTIPASEPDRESFVQGRILALSQRALEQLDPWPPARESLRAYLVENIQSLVDRQAPRLKKPMLIVE